MNPQPMVVRSTDQLQKRIPSFLFSIFLVLLLLASSGSRLFAQEIVIVKTDDVNLKDTMTWRLQNMPALTPLNSNDKLQPRYDYLWIFNDGDYIVGTPDATVKDRSGLSSPATAKGTSYPTGLYSDKNDRPPKIVVSPDFNIPSTTNSDPYTPVRALDDEEYNTSFLRLERNHVNLVPDDTTIWILSFRNILEFTPLSGEVYLFYDSPIDKIYTNPRTKEEVRTRSKDAGGDTQFGEFEYQDKLIYFDGIDNTTYFIQEVITTPLNANYKKAVVWRFDTLQPGVEKRLFIQFRNDENLLNKFPADEEGATRFLAMLVASTTGNETPPNVSNEDAKLITGLGLDRFIEGIPAQQEAPLISDDIFEFGEPYQTMEGPGELLIDVEEVETRLSKAHDPNHMRIDACGCPPQGDGEQLLLATVDFVNDGNARTENIYVQIEIPEEINFNSIADDPISFFPPLDPAATFASVTLERDEAARTITWVFTSFSLNTTKMMGVGHPDTEGQIVFTMLTNTGVDIKDVPEMWACINFSTDPNDEVCTIPVVPNIVEEGDDNSILQCSECKLPPPPSPTLPWWIWLIILLALGIVAWAVWENS
jgi:hypothetical protein